MPPVDSNEPIQSPAPQQPQKVGFWAKLFGKKEAPATQPSVPPQQSSDKLTATPEQQAVSTQPIAGVDVVSTPSQPVQSASDLLQPNPAMPVDTQLATQGSSIGQSVGGQGVNDVNVSQDTTGQTSQDSPNPPTPPSVS